MKKLIYLNLLAAILAFAVTAGAQGTAFTYQGRLISGTNPAAGLFDVRFALFDAASGGAQQGAPLTNAVTLGSNGLFTVQLDFGNQFSGASRWLDLSVRTNGAATFTNLTPRQLLSPTPYAVFAESANATNLVGTVPSANLSGVALLAGGNAFTGTQTVTGGSVGIGTTTPKHKLDVNGNLFLGTAFNGQVFTELGDTLYLGMSRKYLSSTLGAPINGSTDWVNLMCHPGSRGIIFGTSGPTDADPHSAPTPLMILQPNGNVGIGTTNAASLLTVNGFGSPAISLIGNGGSADGQLDFGIAGFNGSFSGSAVPSDAVIRQSGKGKLLLQTGSGSAAITIATNNNVGIGNATPKHKLDVNGNLFIGTAFNGQVFTELGDTLYLGMSRKYLSSTLGAPINGSTDWVNLMCHPGSRGIIFGTSGPTDADPHSAPNPLMILQPNGNVGIGTTNAASLLTVNGFGSPAISLIGNGNSAGGQLDFGIAGGNGSFSGSAVPSDAVIRQLGKGKLILQTGSGSAAITIATNNNVGIGNATPGYPLDVAGSSRVSGLIRLGSETGTTEAPNLQGLVIRRVNSNNKASNNVVAVVASFASSGNFTLVRDGTDGGFQIHYPTLVPNEVMTVACMGMDNTGAPKNFYANLNSGTGTLQVYSNAQNIVHFECTFGDALQVSHHTKVTLTRRDGDFGWVGDLISTFNQ